MNSRYISTILGLIVCSLILSGCAVSTLNPDEVIQRSARALSGLNSFHYQASLALSGNLPTSLGRDITQTHITFSGDVDNQDLSATQFTVDAQVEATSKDGPISIAGQLIGLQDETYFKLTKLVLPTILPVSLGANSQWYKIRHPSVKGEVDKLGVSQTAELTPDQMRSIKESVAGHPLFVVTAAYPDETAGGQRSYHYQAKLDVTNLQQVITELGPVAQLTDVTANLDKLGSYVFEIWVSKHSFQLTRLTTSGIYLVGSVPLGFKLDVTLTQHNDILPIKAPVTSEELGSDYSSLFLPSLGL